MQAISVIKLLQDKLEKAAPEQFHVLQTSIRTYVKHEEICDLIQKIDPEKRGKRDKADPKSLIFTLRVVSGLITVELSTQIIQWLYQVPLPAPPPQLSADESRDDSYEKPCDQPYATRVLNDDLL